jgi:hypothetical protein
MPSVHITSRLVAFCALASFCMTGCFAIPVQETTLKNASGGTVTCKQTGAGLVSGPLAKQRYQECVDKAHTDGYQ